MRRLPGDPAPGDYLQRVVRVDHAGEYGAKRIYAGQLAVLGHDAEQGPLIRHMAGQEEAHLAYFEQALGERRVRPTLLHPLWHAAGYALGAATALMGKQAAMACTAAVETEIDAHYAAQLAKLDASEEPELVAAIERFRGEEAEHHDTAIDQGAELTPGYRALSAVIRAGCRVAIRVTERV